MWKKIKRFFHNLTDREARRRHKMYWKEHKAFIKALKNSVKDAGLFDYSWLEEMTRIWVSHMLNYYKNGYNVWQVDESRLEIVEQLEEVNGLFEQLDHVYDRSNSFLKAENDDDFLPSVNDGDKETWREAVVEETDKEHELYKEIYAKIGEYIQYWWD